MSGRDQSETPEGGKSAGSDYKVGYRRPPTETRFKPGGIGNPKGRPKKRKTVEYLVEEALQMRVPVSENGRTRSLTVQEVIVRNLVRAAAGGDMRSMQTLFAMQQRYRGSQETTLDPAELDKEDRKILDEYVARLQTNLDGPSSPSASGTDQASEKEKGRDGPSTDSGQGGSHERP